MALSIFDDKEVIPGNDDLKGSLGSTSSYWSELKDHVFHKYPEATERWNFPGKKYGWSYSLRDKKRAIVYLTPSDGYFMVGLVFGKKATDQALSLNISKDIKDIISSAKVYAEGRGFRIDITDGSWIPDIKSLIDIKISN